MCEEPKRGLVAGKTEEESVVDGVSVAYSSTLMTGASGASKRWYVSNKTQIVERFCFHRQVT